MFFKKSKSHETQTPDNVKQTIDSLNQLVLEGLEFVRDAEQKPTTEMMLKFAELRLQVQFAHQSLEMIHYCLKQRM